MPYIKTTANIPIPHEKREQLKSQFGQLSSIFGKSEAYLMVNFCENAQIYFGGSEEPAAIVGVELYGSASDDAYRQMTAATTALLEEILGIPANRIFVKYAEYQHWGWNGKNF